MKSQFLEKVLRNKILNNFYNIYSTKNFIMKNKTHLFQKFQKKYLFFQKSFFDFLYWRSTKNLNSYSLPENEFNSKNNLYPFQQEKMSFYEYWKISEYRKIQNTLKSSTKNLNKKPEAFFSISTSFISFDGESKEKKSFLKKDKKNIKSFYSSKKSLNFKTTQKFHLLFLKKRKENFSDIQSKKTKNESFLPKISSFEFSQNLQFFEFQKIGEFFPKKKNFQQYWIFPFLGVLFFFSQNSSSHENIQFLSLLRERKEKFLLSQKFLKSQNNEQNQIFPFHFSFAQKNLMETQFFQNLEKTEYEEFLKFYTKIFQNTISFSEKKNLFSPLLHEGHEKLYLTKTLFLQQSFQKKLETKRNCLNWKWFSIPSLHPPGPRSAWTKSLSSGWLGRDFVQAQRSKEPRQSEGMGWAEPRAPQVNFNFLNLQTMTSISSNFQIPQKAEFFVHHPLGIEFNERKILQEKSAFIKQKKYLSTPLFDYSKSLFLVDEFKRNLSFFTARNFFFSEVSQKISPFDFSNQKVPFSFLIKTPEMQKFFTNEISPSTKYGVASGLDIWQGWNLKPAQHPILGAGVENKAQNNQHIEKNLFFLNKWSKTQKFYTLLNSQQSKTDLSKSQVFDELKNSQKLLNLDVLYFQKLFKKLKNKKLQKKFDVQIFQNEKKKEEKKVKNFFNLKKQTFDFLTFQHYNKSYKQFLNSFWSKSQESKNWKLLFPLEIEKTKTSFFSSFKTKLQKKKYFQTSFYNSQKSKNFGGEKRNSSYFFLKKQKEKKFQNTKEKFSVVEKIVFHNHFDLPLLKSTDEKNFLENSTIFHFQHPILFQFSQKEKISEKLHTKNFYTFGAPSISDLHINLSLYPQNFYRQNSNFSFFPCFREKNFFSDLKESLFTPNKVPQSPQLIASLSSTSLGLGHAEQSKVWAKSQGIEKNNNFSLKFENSNFFENFQEKFFTKCSKRFFSKISQFENFQKGFFTQGANETSQLQKPLLFQKKKWADREKENFSFIQNTQKNQNMNFLMSSRVLVLKPVIPAVGLRQSTNPGKLSFLQYQNSFVFSEDKQKKQIKGFSSTFLGLSRKERKFEKIFQAFFSPLKETKNHFSSRAKRKEKVFAFFEQKKTKKDSIYLQTLANILKKNSQLSSFHFFIPTSKKLSVINNKKNNYQTFFQKDGTQVFRGSQKLTKTSCLSPEFVLKRDGFLFISSTTKAKNFSFQRLDKEKNFQKKRRLKKEKLETRRRKKRKRFFPRPVWLRMNLYKKFLKTRHSQKLLPSFYNPKTTFLDKKMNWSEVFLNNTFYQSKVLTVKPEQMVRSALGETLPKNSSFDRQFFDQKRNWFKKTDKKQLKKYFLKKFLPLPGPSEYIHPEVLSKTLGKGKKTNILKRSSDFQLYNVDSLFLKKQNSTFQSKTYQKNHQRNNWMDEKVISGMGKALAPGLTNRNGKFFGSNFSSNKNKTEKISKNIEHYKISNEIFQEFLRLSWKSSWFQNNFKPYTKTIQENLKKIQSIESQKTSSNFIELLKTKNFIFFFHDFPVFSQQFQNDFLVRKSVLQKFSWYSSIQNSFTPSLFMQSLNHSNANREFLCLDQGKTQAQPENDQKISEYNRILYARISEVLKKFKFSENMTNESFFESLKVSRRKNEKIFSGSNNSFFTKMALFYEKFQVPSEPVIPAFSVFSSLFNDFSIKPTGDIPTLRALWAFQKTNYSHFQERNAIQNFWAFKKRKESFTSFKGTKKIMNFLRKYNGFEKLQAPEQFSSASLATFPIPQYKKTLNTFFETNNMTRNKNMKNGVPSSVFFAKKSHFYICQAGPLDTITLKKFQNVEKKSSLFGIQSLKQNSKISYRYFKFHLSPIFQNQPATQMKKEKNFPGFNPSRFDIEVGQRQVPASEKFLKNQNRQNSAKSSLNFWWAQQPFQTFDFLGTSQFQIFHEFSNRKPFLIQSGLLMCGAFFFHFAIFYSLLKIPEIRSVFKFTFLVFSKFWKSFFLVFFSIYNIFKKYTKTGLNLLKSSSSFTKKKTFDSAHQEFSQPLLRKEMMLLLPQQGQEYFFSQKECINKMSFQRYFFQNDISSKKSSDSFLFSFWQGEESQKTFFPRRSFSFYPSKVASIARKQNQKHNTKFNDFAFEFFPRLSSFLLFQKKSRKFFQTTFKNSLFLEVNKSAKIQKSGKYFQNFKKEKTAFFLGKQKNQTKKNYRQMFLEIKSVKNFDSTFLLKRTAPEFLSVWAEPFHLDKIFRTMDGVTKVSAQQMQTEKIFGTRVEKNKAQIFIPVKRFQNLSKIEKNLSQLALSFLIFGKCMLFVPYSIFKIGSSFLSKIFEVVEGIFYAFYKFLEKPAEFMIEFIAFVFLIEWSSDIVGFFPDSIETSIWKSSQKLLRPVRTGPFFLSGAFFFDQSTKSFSKGGLVFQTFGLDAKLGAPVPENFSIVSPFNFLFSTGFLHFSNFAAYVLQKRLFHVFENFPSILLQPDIDILVCQRKGIIFWDIWAEILLKAAEKYNVNLPSFVTLKEEQELFIEKLVHDSDFFESFSLSDKKEYFHFSWGKINLNFSQNEEKPKQSFKNLSIQEGSRQTKNFEKLEKRNSRKNFSSFLQNFVIQNRPLSFFDFYFSSSPGNVETNSLNSSLLLQKAKNKEKLQQFTVSNLFHLNTEYPQTGTQNFSNIQNLVSIPLNKENKEKFFTFFPFSENFQSLKVFEKVSAEENFNNFQNYHPRWGKIDRWQCNQYATFQSQETDFFLDIYPPKSLKHVHFLKYYEPLHYTLGSLICQIYAGVFPKQISKNILVIGESGPAKTFFLRALAGETEMKIITENASRYAVVQRGVAVGMKYLRDVFDAIALQTPCFFVMEDLHVIGSKRPFMISETESSQNLQSSFGLEQQEVHETNQMIYQSSRHSVSDFRRPYKGDFSIGIPTNFFLQKYYSPFFSSKNSFGQSHISNSGQDSFFYPIKKGHQFSVSGQALPNLGSQFFSGNFSSYSRIALSSPLPIDALDESLQKTGILTPQEKEMNSFESFSTKKNRKKIESCLQFSKEQIFAPPSTSPFTVLMMKEQKKLKPKKIIQETSWGGLSSDQILLYQKESSSIRAKIALFAEKTMNLSRGKFDMITDFLVILDSVRSNRGFVVFGTTHKPSSLDPALRRPGRFDETLSLSFSPNFLNRFEIFKMNLENSVSTFDFFDSSILTENFSEMDLFDILSQTKLSFLHNYKYTFQKSGVWLDAKQEALTFRGRVKPFPYNTQMGSSKFLPQIKNISNTLVTVKTNENFIVKEQIYSQMSPTKAFHALLKSPIFEDFYTQKQFTILSSKGNVVENEHNFSLRNYSLLSVFPKTSFQGRVSTKPTPPMIQTLALSKQGVGKEDKNIQTSPRYSFIPNGPSHMLSLAYSKLGIFLSESNLLYNPNAFIPLSLDIEKNSSRGAERSNFHQFYGNLLYDSKKQRNLQLMVFLSGKIAEFFSQKNFYPLPASLKNQNRTEMGEEVLEKFGGAEQNQSVQFSANSFTNFSFEKPEDFFSTKFGVYPFFSWDETSLDNFQKTKNKKLKKSVFFTKMNFFSREKENQKNPSFNSLQGTFQSSDFPFWGCADQRNFYWTVYGNEESWRSGTPFLFSLIQNRFLFTKNLLLSKMLFFENMDQRRKPPSPPGSSILMPSKKYENFKRTEIDFFQKAHFSIQEKIQLHQKQRFLKELYNIPVQKYFRSELRKNHKTLFSSSFQEFAYLDSSVQKSSSSHSYYRKYIQVRHRFSNINQWWNGMFPEHTRETTYLSDVDWRTMFVSSTGTLGKQGTGTIDQKLPLNKTKSANETFEFLMDFPDAEQYYNPRNRRWFFKSNSCLMANAIDASTSILTPTEESKKTNKNLLANSNFWEIFEKDLQYEIFSHFLMESFYQSFAYFEKKREMLDFFVFYLLHKGFLKEFDFLTTFSRF